MKFIKKSIDNMFFYLNIYFLLFVKKIVNFIVFVMNFIFKFYDFWYKKLNKNDCIFVNLIVENISRINSILFFSVLYL